MGEGQLNLLEMEASPRTWAWEDEPVKGEAGLVW